MSKMHVIKPTDPCKTLCGKYTATCACLGWFRGRKRVASMAARRGMKLCETCERNSSSQCGSFSDRKMWPEVRHA